MHTAFKVATYRQLMTIGFIYYRETTLFWGYLCKKQQRKSVVAHFRFIYCAKQYNIKERNEKTIKNYYYYCTDVVQLPNLHMRSAHFFYFTRILFLLSKARCAEAYTATETRAKPRRVVVAEKYSNGTHGLIGLYTVICGRLMVSSLWPTVHRWQRCLLAWNVFVLFIQKMPVAAGFEIILLNKKKTEPKGMTVSCGWRQ